MNNIENLYEKIEPVNKEIVSLAQKHFDQLIKPVGSLGKLESMVSQYLGIIQEINPSLINYPEKKLFVFSDVVDDKYLSLAKKELLPISILANVVNAKLFIVENNKTEMLSENDIYPSIRLGYKKLLEKDLNKQLLGIGSSSNFTITKSLLKTKNPIELLMYFSDSELAEMVGAIFALAKNGNQIMVDGLKSSVALWIASLFNPVVLDYAVASHISTENNHKELLDFLSLHAVLKLSITQGDCEGSAFAFTVFDAGLKAYKEMDTFNSGNVHEELSDFTKKEN